jgi:conjugal transfer/entry exclusion protein
MAHAGAVHLSNSMKEATVFSSSMKGMSRERSRHYVRRAFIRVPVGMVATVALVALAGCGSSKPAYCSARTNLENSVKNLPSSVSSGISALPSQVTTIKNDATTVVNDAKSDFPTETSAVKSSVDSLQSAVKALPSSPSATQIAALAANAASVVSSVNSFSDASKSKCS